MTSKSTHPLSFFEVLFEFGRVQSEKTAYSWLDANGDVVLSTKYGELVRQTQCLGQAILASNPEIQAGDRLLLVYPPGLAFILAFLACLSVGLVAVPCYPPDPSTSDRMRKSAATLHSIMGSSGAKAALTTSSYRRILTAYNLKLRLTKTALMMEAGDADSKIQHIITQLLWIETDALITSSINKAVGVINNAKVIDPDSLAFLQYTSGSTSEPKGVMITHRNLAHNLELITACLGTDRNTVELSWLPQYHDMGLIGSYMGCLWCGGTGFYMSPLAFIRDPVLFLRCISRYKGTHVQAPNFAYALMSRKFLAAVKRIKVDSTLGKNKNNSNNGALWLVDFDLSSMRHMITAAEPIEATVVDTFQSVLGPYGLPAGVVFPTYGLAEHTVFVTGNGRARVTVDCELLESSRVVKIVTPGAEGTRSAVYVGCGRPDATAGLDLRIVDPDSCEELGERRVGEIWADSPSKAAGYWEKRDDVNKDAFGSGLKSKSETTTTRFLRTGDLGFLHQGELFVCGRLKDLIIVMGRNYHPQDIERTLEDVVSGASIESASEGSTCDSFPQIIEHGLKLRPGCSAAFSINVAGQEALAFVAEIHPDSATASGDRRALDAFIQLLLDECATAHGLQLVSVGLLPPRTIQKTSSGKIQRHAVRSAYLQGQLSLLGGWSDLDRMAVADDIFGYSIGTGGVTGGEGAETQKQPACHMSASASASASDCAIDPVGQPMHVVLDELQRVLRGALHLPASAPLIDPDAALSCLGLDSMQGVELQVQLETAFTVALPDEILADPDATLTTFAKVLISGGQMQTRPLLLDGYTAFKEAVRRTAARAGKEPASGRLPSVWFREHQTQAHIDLLSFPDNIARPTIMCACRANNHFLDQAGAMGPPGQPKADDGKATAADKRWHALLSFLFFGAVYWIPLLLLAATWVALMWLPVEQAVAVASASSALFALCWIMPLMPSTSILLSALGAISRLLLPSRMHFKHSWIFGLLLRYHSYKVILEEHPDQYEHNGPCVFTFSPHGAAPIAATMQVLLSEWLLGLEEGSLQLFADSSTMSVPLYGLLLWWMGFERQDPDSTALVELLKRGKSVGVAPGGLEEAAATRPFYAQQQRMLVRNRKAFVMQALQTGAQLVPCFTFGGGHVFRSPPPPSPSSSSSYNNNKLGLGLVQVQRLLVGRFCLPIPLETPLVTVVGRPILLPRVNSPSPELVNEYHERWLRDNRRIFEKYKNVYGWNTAELEMLR